MAVSDVHGSTDDEHRKRLLSEYLPFEAIDDPGWDKKEDVSVEKMIAEILTYHKEWEKIKDGYDEELINEVQQKFLVAFIFHMNEREERCFSTVEEFDKFLKDFDACGGNLQRRLSIREQETLNVKNAYEHLLEKIKSNEESSDYGLLAVSLLKGTHRMLMEGIEIPKDQTKPGEFSNKPRTTEFDGEEYNYQNPEDMEIAVWNLLDRCNARFDLCIKDGLKDCDFLYYLFKTCAWLLFELLDLHPFSDGNGRLCRILCSYMLSKVTPFPTPVFNVFTNSSKDDYKDALVAARKSKERHPCALTTMIIECSYQGWKKFKEAIEKKAHISVCMCC